MVDPGLLLGYFANGIVFGGILALGAVGLSLVYGILRLSNFAHGDFLTLGAFLSLWFAVELSHVLPVVGLGVAVALGTLVLLDAFTLRWLNRGERAILSGFAALLALLHVPLVLSGVPASTTNHVLLAATALSVATAAALLVALEFLLWRPLRRKRATVLSFIIVAIAVSLVVRNGLQIHFGGGSRFFTRPTPLSDVVLGARISDAQQFTLGAAVLLIASLHVFLKYTKTGKAMRALADNPELARVSGIDVDRMILYVWVIAGAFAAIAGVLLSLVLNNNMHVNMGFNLLLPLFAAVILGGIGSPYGAIAGGFIVGIAMKTSVLWLRSEYELMAAFIILFLVILVRPQGVFGWRATT